MVGKKLEKFSICFPKSKPPIICFTETHVTKDIIKTEYDITGYKHEHVFSNNRRTGGCAIYIREDIKYDSEKRIQKDNICDIIGVRILSKNKPLFLYVVYHSPSNSAADFMEFLEEWVPDLIDLRGNLLLVGDFNVNMMRDTTYSRKLREIIDTSGLYFISDGPTRYRTDGETEIDLVITNNTDIFNVISEPLRKLSDHESMSINYDFKPKTIQKRKNKNNIQKIIYKNCDFDKLNNKIKETEKCDKNDVNALADHYTKTMVDNIKLCSQEKTVRSGSDYIQKPWFKDNVELRRLYVVKCIEWDSVRKLKTDDQWCIYKKARNAFVKKLNYEKKKYFCEQIENAKFDSKLMWKVLKNLVQFENKNKSDCFENLNFNDDGQKKLSDSFNKFFVQSVIEICDSIQNVNNVDDNIEICDTVLSKFNEINMDDLRNIVNNLKNKNSSTDGVTVAAIKHTFDTCGNELLNIINKSISKGQFPEGWKTSMVIPVPKVSSPKTPVEYRPINMLPIYEKILELSIHKQLLAYFEKNNIFYKFQSGFRKCMSTETAVQYLISKWKKILDSDETIITVMLDLKRAFETIDRAILLRKLQSYGVTGTALQWISSYLTGRKQVTKVDGELSDEISVDIGVPQGSVLGPLLFIVYINDMPDNLKKSFINLFADDTLLWYHGKNFNDVCNTVNIDLQCLSEWFKINKLKLNVTKTQCMIIASSKVKINNLLRAYPESKILLDEIEINYETNVKYLGVYIDQELKFNDHVNIMQKKISKKLGYLSRIGKNLDMQTRNLVYKTIIAPHFEYCSTIMWCTSDCNLKKLQMLQNKAMRIVLFVDRRTHVPFMIDVLQWLTIEQRLALNMCMFLKNVLLNNFKNFDEFMVKNSAIHKYSTRTASAFHFFSHNKSGSQKCIFYNGLKFYNGLDESIREEIDLKIFKRKCIEHVKANIMYKYSSRRML